jgi:hypothetical protein
MLTPASSGRHLPAVGRCCSGSGRLHPAGPCVISAGLDQPDCQNQRAFLFSEQCLPRDSFGEKQDHQRVCVCVCEKVFFKGNNSTQK